LIEVFTEVGAGLLGMDEAHFPALLDEIGQNAQEGTVFNVKVLDIGRTYPEGALDRGTLARTSLKWASSAMY